MLVMIFSFLWLAIVITLGFFFLFSDWPLWLLWSFFSFSLIGHCDYFGFFSFSLIGHCEYFGFFFFLFSDWPLWLLWFFFPFLWLAIVITFGFTSLNRETLYQSNVIIEICDAEFEYIKILPFLQGCWAIGSRLHLQGRRSELSAWCWYGTGWFLHFPTGGVVHMIQFVQHSKE